MKDFKNSDGITYKNRYRIIFGTADAELKTFDSVKQTAMTIHPLESAPANRGVFGIGAFPTDVVK